MEREITIGELIKIYRGALISLIPWVEKLGVPWRMRESYDEWDNLLASLYYNILCAALYSGVAVNYPIFQSEDSIENFSSLDFIAIRLTDDRDRVAIFKDLESLEYPLDTIIVLVVDSSGTFIEKKMIEYNDDFEFYFAKVEEGKRQIIESVKVGFD